LLLFLRRRKHEEIEVLVVRIVENEIKWKNEMKLRVFLLAIMVVGGYAKQLDVRGRRKESRNEAVLPEGG